MTYTRNLEAAWKFALAEIDHLQVRVAELEQEREQVCKWDQKVIDDFLPKRYYSPHIELSAIWVFKDEYKFCSGCGKRIKYVESEGE